jgi:hypothetical protein
MRQVVAALLVIVIGYFARPAATPLEAQGAGKPAVRACSLLTKELVTKVTPYSEEQKRLVFMVPPNEDSLGASGSACHYGGITFQIDPFKPESLDAMSKKYGKAWVPVPDVGDAAYFHDNRGRWGELVARAGAHVFTIQMGVPTGRTTESIKPNVIALANAIIPTLR